MAETMLSIAEILASLPDNNSKLITPQAMRNAVYSLQRRYGSMYMETPVLTPLAINTPAKAEGITTFSPDFYDFSMPDNNHIQYNGIKPVSVEIYCGYSMTCASNNQRVFDMLAINGVPAVATRGDRLIGTGSDVGRGSVGGSIVFNQGDYASLWLENVTGSFGATVTSMTFTVGGGVV